MNQVDYKKKYNEALERMKSWAMGEHPECFTEARKAAEFIFPELAESEDERIRKEIVDYLKSFIPHHDDDLVTKSKVWIAWLEKQKLRSPLSKDEEYTLARIIEYLEDNDCPSEWKNLLHDVYILPYQKEQRHWSEDDEKMLIGQM